MLPPQQLWVFVSDKLPGKIAFEKASLLKQLSNHFGREMRILPFVQPCFSCLLIWRKRVLASGPASESLVRRFSPVSPNFDPSLWIKGPQFSRSTGFGLWFPGLAEGTGVWSAPGGVSCNQGGASMLFLFSERADVCL